MSVTEIVDLTDTLAHLNMAMPADAGAKVQTYIDACTVVVEDVVGPVIPVQITEIHSGGDTSIWLRRRPVLSVVSITELIGMTAYTLTEQPVGQAVDNFGYSIDDAVNGKIVRRSAASTPFPFYGNTGNITVVYMAGRDTVPANIKFGLLELLRLAWQYGQQGNRPPFGALSAAGAAEESSVTPTGFLVPNRVKEFLQPSLDLPVFA